MCFHKIAFSSLRIYSFYFSFFFLFPSHYNFHDFFCRKLYFLTSYLCCNYIQIFLSSINFLVPNEIIVLQLSIKKTPLLLPFSS